MSKTIAFAALAVLTLSGPALAGDHHRTRTAFQPSAPQPIMEVVSAGGGTVTGTVGTVAATWFVLNDGQTEIPVTTRGFLPDSLQSGERVTVVGDVRRDAIQVGQLIREDGSAFGRDVGGPAGGDVGRERERHRRHHDDD